MKNIIFLGAPGSGKGTHSNYLVDKFGYIQISTGELLREISSQNTELGRKIKNIMATGDFVDDETVLELIKNKLARSKGKPFILDGFPRNLSQANALEIMLKKMHVDYTVIYFDIEKELCRERIVGRLTCSCGMSYNLYTDLKPKIEGICNRCGKKLSRREDDNEESFQKRYELYIQNTLPIIEYYEKQKKLNKIDANTSKTRDSLNILDSILEVIND